MGRVGGYSSLEREPWPALSLAWEMQSDPLGRKTGPKFVESDALSTIQAFGKEDTFANALADLRDHCTGARCQQWPWLKSCVLEANWCTCPSDFTGFRLQLTGQGAGGRNLGKVLPLVSALGARDTYKDSVVSVHKLEAFLPSESPAGLPPATRFCALESYQL